MHYEVVWNSHSNCTSSLGTGDATDRGICRDAFTRKALHIVEKMNILVSFKFNVIRVVGCVK